MDLLAYARKVNRPQHPALCWLLGDPITGRLPSLQLTKCFHPLIRTLTTPRFTWISPPSPLGCRQGPSHHLVSGDLGGVLGTRSCSLNTEATGQLSLAARAGSACSPVPTAGSVLPRAPTRKPVTQTFEEKLVPGGASSLLPETPPPFSYFRYFPSGHFSFLFLVCSANSPRLQHLHSVVNSQVPLCPAQRKQKAFH